MSSRARRISDTGDLDDEPARFQQRNERSRQHQRAVRLAPAHQHLGAAQPAGRDVDHRLKIGHELAGLERALDLGDRIVAPARGNDEGKADDRQRDHAA